MRKFFHRKTAWLFTQLIPYWTARVRTTVKLLVRSDHVLFFHKLTHYVKLWRDQSSALKQIHTAIKIIKKTSNTQNQLKRNFQYTVFAVRKGEKFYPCYCTKLGITQNFLSEYNGHIQNTSFKPSFFFFFIFRLALFNVGNDIISLWPMWPNWLCQKCENFIYCQQTFWLWGISTLLLVHWTGANLLLELRSIFFRCTFKLKKCLNFRAKTLYYNTPRFA